MISGITSNRKQLRSPNINDEIVLCRKIHKSSGTYSFSVIPNNLHDVIKGSISFIEFFKAKQMPTVSIMKPEGLHTLFRSQEKKSSPKESLYVQ